MCIVKILLSLCCLLPLKELVDKWTLPGMPFLSPSPLSEKKEERRAKSSDEVNLAPSHKNWAQTAKLKLKEGRLTTGQQNLLTLRGIHSDCNRGRATQLLNASLFLFSHHMQITLSGPPTMHPRLNYSELELHHIIGSAFSIQGFW